jgi:hypothetical protein
VFPAACPLGFRDEVHHPVFTDAHLSWLVNSLKGVSSRRLRQEFPDLARHCWQATRLRSGSYFAGGVGGAPLNVLVPRQATFALLTISPRRRSRVLRFRQAM